HQNAIVPDMKLIEHAALVMWIDDTDVHVQDCSVTLSSQNETSNAFGSGPMVIGRSKTCVWKKKPIVIYDGICPVESDQDPFPPVAALSDVEISPQSILR
ncbi:hypothetical protein A2U01_0072487, partial [Trifolium medium]|nr:hypothetical protein [Trifolium medium]